MTLRHYGLALISVTLAQVHAAPSSSSNSLNIKAVILAGTCEVQTTNSLDLGNLAVGDFSSGGTWAGLSATTPGNVTLTDLLVKARCDSGSASKTLVLSVLPQKAQLTGNQIFPNEYSAPIGRVKATSPANNVGVVVFYNGSNVLAKNNTSAVNISNYIGSSTTLTNYTFKVRYQKINSANPVTAGGVLSQLNISVSYK